MPSMMRRMRTRLPTYLSTGLGALVDISTLLGIRLRAGSCLGRQYLLGSVGEEYRQFEQRTDWSFSRLVRQNANGVACLSTLDFRSRIFPTDRKSTRLNSSHLGI